MEPERWQKIDQLLKAASRRKPTERAAFLNHACEGDDGLRREVESMLIARQQLGSFVESLPDEVAAESSDSQATIIPSGLALDRYKIHSLIGVGGMGRVYLAHDRKLLLKPVVIKVLAKEASQNHWIKRKFRQEVEALARINHPCVVGVLDAGETVDGELYIAMEFIEGDNLRSEIGTAGMDFKRVADIFRQLGQAIGAAHEKGICHRDLKPENIMLQSLGEGEHQVKLIDFGIAGVKDSVIATSHQTTAVSGTVAYMAPEQLMGKPAASSDIYAMGVIAYEMLTGSRPFNPDSPYQLLELQRAGVKVKPADLRSELPEAAQAAILKSLSFDPHSRYQRARDFAEALIRTLIGDVKERSLALPSVESRRAPEIKTFGPAAADPVTEKITDSRPNNLPLSPASLIGRDGEIVEVKKLLRQDDVRLLTLTGPGGTGKTSLGLQAAESLIEDFYDGVFFVSLAPISDGSLVASEIAQTLGVAEEGGVALVESLKQYLRDRKMLLLLDNFEQLISFAPVVAELLEACPRLKMLVTSRSLLRVRSEREFAVPPLALPDLGRMPSIETLELSPAVTLFIKRAQTVKPGFNITSENALAVAGICARLDGLPLAIELAAARIKLLTPQAMLARLDNRLRLLTGGARDLPARQQTMRGAIAYSYDLLEESEKTLFRWLSVFVGGFTLEAAEELCSRLDSQGADVLEGVSSLLDDSLLRCEEMAEGETRFLMLETIREYGLEQMAESGETETARRAHEGIFLDLVTMAEPELRGPEQAAWLDRLEREHDNLRAALRWAGENEQAETGLRIAASLWRFWEVRGHLSEGRETLKRLLASAKEKTGERAKSLYVAGSLARSQADHNSAEMLLKEGLALYRELKDDKGAASSLNRLGTLALDQSDYGEAESLTEQGLQLYRKLEDSHGVAASLTILGVVSLRRGDYEQAIVFQEESIKIRRELSDKLGVASSLNDLGVVSLDRGDYERAAELFAESLILFRQLGDRLGIAYSLNNLGEMAQHQGDYERAAAMYAESLTIFRELGDKRDIATLLNNLGDVARYQKDYKQAAKLYAESLSLLQEVGERVSMAFCFEGLAAVACEQGQADRAAQLFGAAEALREAVGAPLPPARQSDYNESVSTTRDALGEDAFAAMWIMGREMKLESAVACALTTIIKV